MVEAHLATPQVLMGEEEVEEEKESVPMKNRAIVLGERRTRIIPRQDFWRPCLVSVSPPPKREICDFQEELSKS